MRLLTLLLGLLFITGSLIAIGLMGDRYATDGMEFYHRGDYQNAINSFKLADKAAEGKKAEYSFWLGRLHIAIEDTLNAKRWLGIYLETGDETYSKEAGEYLEIINRQTLIFEKVSMRDMPKYLNSRNSDYGPVVTPDGKHLYFTSLRPSRYDKENIWRAERLNNLWGKPNPVDELNTDKNESIGSFSSDGSRAYIFGNFERGKIDGDLYLSNLGKTWQTPIPIPELNSPLIDLQPMVYEDSLMFFTSTREGGMGGTDIYVSEYQNGAWQEAINLGPTINTMENEQTPFLDWDGKTLFFASNGHPGFGGFDLFKTVKIGESWTQWSLPENLGLPLNSIKNDRYFYHIKDTNEAFITSDRTSDGFENIYIALLDYAPREFLIVDADTGEKLTVFDDDTTSPISGDEKIEEETPIVSQPKFVNFRGRVTDENNNPLPVELLFNYLLDSARMQDVAKTNDNGEFDITLPYAPSYNVVVNKDGFFLHSQDVPVSDDQEDIQLNILLKKMEEKKVFVFNNIQFEFDSSILKEESYPVLNEIALTLLNNPDVKVEISGHTCNMGSDKYNLWLSDKRAASVVNYMLSKGVEAERMISLGFGMSKPIGPNDTIAQRQVNRRVEIKVLENKE